MRKLFILLLGIVFYSCSENDRLIYSEGMHDIYYSDVTKDKDSIFVSLLTAERELTTTINVKLLGSDGRFLNARHRTVRTRLHVYGSPWLFSVYFFS